jgi:hypothetical protein
VVGGEVGGGGEGVGVVVAEAAAMATVACSRSAATSKPPKLQGGSVVVGP